MAVTRSNRLFTVYDGDKEVQVKDPLPGGSILEVKKILSGKYPYVTNATVIGPNQLANGDVGYEFKKTAGEKG